MGTHEYRFLHNSRFQFLYVLNMTLTLSSVHLCTFHMSHIINLSCYITRK